MHSIILLQTIHHKFVLKSKMPLRFIKLPTVLNNFTCITQHAALFTSFFYSYGSSMPIKAAYNNFFSSKAFSTTCLRGKIWHVHPLPLNVLNQSCNKRSSSDKALFVNNKSHRAKHLEITSDLNILTQTHTQYMHGFLTQHSRCIPRNYCVK